MARKDGRAWDQLRPIEFVMNYTKWAEGSVLVKFGDTHVLCNATVDERVPRWLYQQEKSHGWITAEYGLLPRSTEQRVQREQRWPKGRTQEISRLIGRSLRMAVDLHAMGMRQVIVDCDVLQADGGTRTAAVTGGWLATQLALQPLVDRGDIPSYALSRQIAAVSVGIVKGEILLDLDYREDMRAEFDLNVVVTADDEIVEVQGTAEEAPISRTQMDQMIDLAMQGTRRLAQLQHEAWTAAR